MPVCSGDDVAPPGMVQWRPLDREKVATSGVPCRKMPV